MNIIARAGSNVFVCKWFGSSTFFLEAELLSAGIDDFFLIKFQVEFETLLFIIAQILLLLRITVKDIGETSSLANLKTLS